MNKVKTAQTYLCQPHISQFLLHVIMNNSHDFSDLVEPNQDSEKEHRSCRLQFNIWNRPFPVSPGICFKVPQLYPLGFKPIIRSTFTRNRTFYIQYSLQKCTIHFCPVNLLLAVQTLINLCIIDAVIVCTEKAATTYIEFLFNIDHPIYSIPHSEIWHIKHVFFR